MCSKSEGVQQGQSCRDFGGCAVRLEPFGVGCVG